MPAEPDRAVPADERRVALREDVEQMPADEAGGAGDENAGHAGTSALSAAVLRLVIRLERRVALLDRAPPPLVLAIPVDGVSRKPFSNGTCGAQPSVRSLVVSSA